jgi:hypothetical protein
VARPAIFHLLAAKIEEGCKPEDALLRLNPLKT